MTIKKWNVYVADLTPRRGTEPRKVRPVIVVQTDLLNGKHPSTVVCPLTTVVQPAAKLLRVHLRSGDVGLKRKSDIMIDQIRAIDNRRLLRLLGRAPARIRRDLAANLRVLLG